MVTSLSRVGARTLLLLPLLAASSALHVPPSDVVPALRLRGGAPTSSVAQGLLAPKNAIPAFSTLMGLQIGTGLYDPNATLKNYGFPEPYSPLSQFFIIEISFTLLHYVLMLYAIPKGEIQTMSTVIWTGWVFVLLHMLYTSKVAPSLSQGTKLKIFPYIIVNAALAVASYLGHHDNVMTYSSCVFGPLMLLQGIFPAKSLEAYEIPTTRVDEVMMRGMAFNVVINSLTWYLYKKKSFGFAFEASLVGHLLNVIRFAMFDAKDGVSKTLTLVWTPIFAIFLAWHRGVFA